MSPLVKRILVLIMFWVFLFMIVSQVYDSIRGNGTTSAQTTASSPASLSGPTPDPTIQAIANDESCIAADSKNVACLEDLGNLYYGLGQYPQAQTAFESAIRLDPHNVGVLVKLAGSYIRQSEFDKALLTLQQAVAIEPDSPELHLLLGLALDKANPPQTAQAKSEWQQVIKLAPGTTWAQQAQQYIASP